ncbi:MAG TPA: hypothetical protein VKS79_01980 [Gemmataceae bacterium]|nr:hypothetical protein [Gemmataceae bacterium]
MATTSEYLVAHGCTAALTRCRDGGSLCPNHGESIVIRSARGVELGEVLCRVDESGPALPPVTGEVLRRATPDDQAHAHEQHVRSQELLVDAQQLIEQMQLPLAPLDADVLLDSSSAILHVLCWQQCTLTPFLEELRARHDLLVTVHDQSRPAEAQEHGCSECGSGGGCGKCGDGGCGESGCGSGNCSRDKFDHPEELTRYFAALRELMLARERVPLL